VGYSIENAARKSGITRVVRSLKVSSDPLPDIEERCNYICVILYICIRHVIIYSS